jgi:hypothetical protein
VVPGVVLCEMIGQNCAVLLGDQLKGKTRVFYRHEPGEIPQIRAPGGRRCAGSRHYPRKGPFFITGVARCWTARWPRKASFPSP